MSGPETQKRKLEDGSGQMEAEVGSGKKRKVGDEVGTVAKRNKVQEWIDAQGKDTELVIINQHRFGEDPTQFIVRKDFVDEDSRRKLTLLHTKAWQDDSLGHVEDWFLDLFEDEDPEPNVERLAKGNEHFVSQQPIGEPVSGNFREMYNVYLE